MRMLICLAVFALILTGCGESKTVHVGKGGEEGTYARTIHKSKDVGVEGTNFQKQNEKEVYDGQ
ncbi:MAG: hypothetical protein ABL949_14535 [Fimbriimonadaceae bacterium]